MILFKEIYDKAVNLFDDPDIRRAYIYDKVKFGKIMYSYMQNAITLVRTPMTVASALVDQEEPVGRMEVFNGNGGRVYELSSNPVANSDFMIKIAGVKDNDAVYNEDNKTVTFSRDVTSEEECSVEWYFSGSFKTSFGGATTTGVSSTAVRQNVMDLLARALVLSWAEKEKNFALDIRNILTDTDFKMYSPANTIRAKVDWVQRLQFEFDSLQNKLAWTMFGHFRSGGQKYGP